MTAFAFQVSASSYSQSITFSGKNVKLESVFQAVEKQTGYVFFYDAKELKNARPVTISATNEPTSGFSCRNA